MPIYTSDFEVEWKEDESPLTAADKASHEYIVEKLEKRFPHIPVLSEESVSIPWEERRKWKEYWLIDPLDGTKEFIKKNGEFTVNIALIRQNVSALGVVYSPEYDVCWFAAEGKGAFRQEGVDRAVRIKSSCPDNLDALAIVGSRSHQSEAVSAFLEFLTNPELLPMGSSLKICAVAEGKADIYPRLGLTSEWDTAAAHCVVTESGGYLLDEHGVPLIYNSKESLLNPHFIVLGGANGRWREEVIHAFRKANELTA
ncbi:3'(2'),5'-bisphosphate nucleotidase CysQ [Pseudodesulfovibrio sp. zrk46]|uniref:3'(2'),5'-bisphosphate nucleotidase CysQ n=1 Tax=Pseudodesulfovibrio sp. zrk46 TaxID=2725288 RepID=UPI001FFDA0BF|nr:3'(2'),5'-bisphosphate nucleotidase CysQ [Pseudodesulfovibrio sp. zrk46]